MELEMVMVINRFHHQCAYLKEEYFWRFRSIFIKKTKNFENSDNPIPIGR